MVTASTVVPKLLQNFCQQPKNLKVLLQNDIAKRESLVYNKNNKENRTSECIYKNVKMKSNMFKKSWELNFPGLFGFKLIASGRRNLIFQCPKQAVIKNKREVQAYRTSVRYQNCPTLMGILLDCASTKKLNPKPRTDIWQTLKPLWCLHFATAGKPEKGFRAGRKDNTTANDT